jgi:hypothetical protein
MKSPIVAFILNFNYKQIKPSIPNQFAFSLIMNLLAQENLFPIKTIQ